MFVGIVQKRLFEHLLYPFEFIVFGVSVCDYIVGYGRIAETKQEGVGVAFGVGTCKVVIPQASVDVTRPSDFETVRQAVALDDVYARLIVVWKKYLSCRTDGNVVAVFVLLRLHALGVKRKNTSAFAGSGRLTITNKWPLYDEAFQKY